LPKITQKYLKPTMLPHMALPAPLWSPIQSINGNKSDSENYFSVCSLALYIAVEEDWSKGCRLP